MKLKLTVLLTSLAFVAIGIVAALPSRVAAVDVVQPVCNNVTGSEQPAVCKDNNTDGGNPILGPDGVLTTYIRILSYAIGVISIIVIIIGGIRFITSNGDSQTVNAAQKTVIYAVVGLVVAAFSQALVLFVLSKI